jgi:hypothetical protein
VVWRLQEPFEGKIWSWVPRDLEPRTTVLAKTISNLLDWIQRESSSSQTLFSSNFKTCKSLEEPKYDHGPRRGSKPRTTVLVRTSCDLLDWNASGYSTTVRYFWRALTKSRGHNGNGPTVLWVLGVVESLCQVLRVVSSAQHIPTAVNLCFLNRSRYFFIQVASHLSSRGWVHSVPDFSENLVGPGIVPGTSGSVARNSDHETTEVL